MKRIDRPPIIKVKVILKVVLLALLLVLFGENLLEGLDDSRRISQARQNAVTVSAVVSNVEADYNSDYVRVYHVYIRYNYKGDRYDVRYLSNKRNSSWMDRVGETLSVQIDPERPDHLIDKMEDNARYTPLGFGIINLWLAILAIPSRRKWTEVYGCGTSNIQQDLKDLVCRRWLWKWGLLTGAEMIVARMILREGIPGYAVPLGAVLIWLGSKGLKRRRADLQKIDNEEYTVRNITLTAKYEMPDNDGGTDYCLEYTDENGSWRNVVSYREYQSAMVGQVKRGVYMPQEKKPTLLLFQGSAEVV